MSLSEPELLLSIIKSQYASASGCSGAFYGCVTVRPHFRPDLFILNVAHWFHAINALLINNYSLKLSIPSKSLSAANIISFATIDLKSF